MPAAEYLSQDNNAANGAWFEVADGDNVTVTMNGACEPRSLLRLEVQDDDGAGVVYDALMGWPAEKRARSITAQGIYRLVRPEQDAAIGASIYPSAALPVAIEFSGTFADGEDAVAYDEDVGITGGTAPYTITASSGLPTGLTASIATTNINLAGTPTVADDYDISITVQDALGNSAVFEDSITIALGA